MDSIYVCSYLLAYLVTLELVKQLVHLATHMLLPIFLHDVTSPYSEDVWSCNLKVFRVIILCLPFFTFQHTPNGTSQPTEGAVYKTKKEGVKESIHNWKDVSMVVSLNM